MQRRIDYRDFEAHNFAIRIQLQTLLRSGETMLYGQQYTYHRLKQISMPVVRNPMFQILKEHDRIGVATCRIYLSSRPQGAYLVPGPNFLFNLLANTSCAGLLLSCGHMLGCSSSGRHKVFEHTKGAYAQNMLQKCWGLKVVCSIAKYRRPLCWHCWSVFKMYCYCILAKFSTSLQFRCYAIAVFFKNA